MKIPIDLSALTPAERTLFDCCQEALDSVCETVCCFYLRYSSDKQTEQSIEGQLRDLLDFCKRMGYRCAAVYVDRAISAHASMEKRPAFQQMLTDSARSEWTIVLVWKLDRFARRREDAAIARMRLRKNGCTVESAKENISKNPEGVILESLLEGMAEYYSAELSQKVKRGMRETALKGSSTGGVIPLGYKSVNKRLEPDPVYAPIVKEMFERYAAGETATSIMRDLNARGYRTQHNMEFRGSTFSRIMANKKYIGICRYGDVYTEDVIPPIIDKELFDAVQKKLKQVAEAPAKTKAKVPYLLSQKIFCGHCGNNMFGESGRGKQGRIYHYYACYSKKRGKGCRKKNLQKDWIEGVVAEQARAMLTGEVIDYIATMAEKQSEEAYRATSKAPALQKAIKENETKIRNLTAAIEESGATSSYLISRIAELEGQTKALQSELVKEEGNTVRLTKDKVVFWLEKVRDKVAAVGDQTAMLLDLLVNSVTVWDDGPDGITIKTAFNITGLPEKTYKVPAGSPPSGGEMCSDLMASGSPDATHPNPTITFVGFLLVQTQRYSLP